MQFEFSTRPSSKNLMALTTQWLINAIALVLVARFIDGVSLESNGTDGLVTVLGASAVLGFFNVLLKPFLILVTLPINILTLGLFTLVINAGVLALTAYFVRGLIIHGFWPALWGALTLSLLSMIFNGLFSNFSVSFKTGRGR